MGRWPCVVDLAGGGVLVPRSAFAEGGGLPLSSSIYFFLELQQSRVFVRVWHAYVLCQFVLYKGGGNVPGVISVLSDRCSCFRVAKDEDLCCISYASLMRRSGNEGARWG